MSADTPGLANTLKSIAVFGVDDPARLAAVAPYFDILYDVISIERNFPHDAVWVGAVPGAGSIRSIVLSQQRPVTAVMELSSLQASELAVLIGEALAATATGMRLLGVREMAGRIVLGITSQATDPEWWPADQNEEQRAGFPATGNNAACLPVPRALNWRESSGVRLIRQDIQPGPTRTARLEARVRRLRARVADKQSSLDQLHDELTQLRSHRLVRLAARLSQGMVRARSSRRARGLVSLAVLVPTAGAVVLGFMILR